MAGAEDRLHPAEETPPTDFLFALVGGLYVTSIVFPAIMFLIARAVTNAAVLYVSFLLIVFGLTALSGWSLSRISGIATRIGARDKAWLLAVLPAVWITGMYLATSIGVEPPSIMAPLTGFGTAFGLFLGLALVGMSRTRYVQHLVDAGDVEFEWEARWPPRWRRVASVVSILAFSGSAIGIIAAFGFGFERAWSLYYLMFVAIPLMFMVNPRTFQVTPHGLVIGHQLQRQLRPWAEYTGYSMTADSVVIHRKRFWRPDHRCDRSEIDHLDSLEAELRRYIRSG